MYSIKSGTVVSPFKFLCPKEVCKTSSLYDVLSLVVIVFHRTLELEQSDDIVLHLKQSGESALGKLIVYLALLLCRIALQILSIVLSTSDE